jgi:prepilin signal peptidase PulO-like enzyme (type II secretory pathway)
LGVLLGAWLGYRYLWLGLLLAYLAGAIIALTLIAFGKKKFSSQIPLGPFLLIAAWLVYLYGPLIVNWYWHLLV